MQGQSAVSLQCTFFEVLGFAAASIQNLLSGLFVGEAQIETKRVNTCGLSELQVLDRCLELEYSTL